MRYVSVKSALFFYTIAAVLFFRPTGYAHSQDRGVIISYRYSDLRGRTQDYLAQIRRSINDYQTAMMALTSRAQEADQWTRSGFQTAVREYQRKLANLQRSMLNMQTAGSPLEWNMRRGEVDTGYSDLIDAYEAADMALRQPVSRGLALAPSGRGYYDRHANLPRQGTPAPGTEREQAIGGRQDKGSMGSGSSGLGIGTAAPREMLLGDIVVGLTGEVIGRIDSFLTGYDGMVKYAVMVATDERLYPVPSQVLRPTDREGRYLLGVVWEQLKDAPSFTRKTWPGLTDRDWQRKSYVFYNGGFEGFADGD